MPLRVAVAVDYAATTSQRAFIAHLEKRAKGDPELKDSSKFAEWIAWAHGKVSELDPTDLTLSAFRRNLNRSA